MAVNQIKNAFSMNIPPLPHGTNALPGNSIVTVQPNAWSAPVMTNFNTAERMLNSRNVRFGRKRTRKLRKTRKASRKHRVTRRK